MKIELDHQELETVVKTVLEHLREDRQGITKEAIKVLGPTLVAQVTDWLKTQRRPKIVPDAPTATGTDD